jgi:hypothetical protein
LEKAAGGMGRQNLFRKEAVEVHQRKMEGVAVAFNRMEVF